MSRAVAGELLIEVTSNLENLVHLRLMESWQLSKAMLSAGVYRM
jgi:hypothetical protein